MHLVIHYMLIKINASRIKLGAFLFFCKHYSLPIETLNRKKEWFIYFYHK